VVNGWMLSSGVGGKTWGRRGCWSGCWRSSRRRERRPRHERDHNTWVPSSPAAAWRYPRRSRWDLGGECACLPHHC
jgi:hypothetical protein